MDRNAVLAGVRAKYPMYSDLSDDVLAGKLAAKYPQYRDLVQTAEPRVIQEGGSTPRNVPGPASHPWVQVNKAASDPSMQIPGTEDLPHPAEVIATGASIPLTMGGGALGAKLLPQLPKVGAALGRIGSSGILGAGEAAVKGGDPLASGGQAAGISAAWEAILGTVPHLPKLKLAARAGDLEKREWSFENAKNAVNVAYKKLSPYVPKGAWMELPSISKKPLTFQQATNRLANLERVDFDVARAEIQEALKKVPSALSGPALNPPVKASVALGSQPIRPSPDAMAASFGARTSETPFTPRSTPMERFARGTVGAMGDNAVRAGVDTTARQEPEDLSGVSMGAVPLIIAGDYIGSGLNSLAQKIVGGR
jgi:hypothetical protein